MSQVTLSVGGRSYKIACADGEEAHITQLANIIDGKLQQMGPNRAPSDAQNLLFAALLLADELHEKRKAEAARPNGAAIAETLERVAETLEKSAALLERKAATS